MEDNRNMNAEMMAQEAAQAAQDAPQAAGDTDTAQAVEAPQNKPADAHSMNYTHTFNPPIEITGKQYKSLTFYFERLTGEDVEAVELELQQRNIIVLDASISSAFQSTIAARAARIPSDELRLLPMADYMRIKNAARDFLVAVGY